MWLERSLGQEIGIPVVGVKKGGGETLHFLRRLPNSVQHFPTQAQGRFNRPNFESIGHSYLLRRHDIIRQFIE
jgi:hypothetical protein